jgi:hypothetical protein
MSEEKYSYSGEKVLNGCCVVIVVAYNLVTYGILQKPTTKL